ncbi:hypothetical protein AB0K60_10010 [Thermopolyspora sp. NPDC052614]|uniref:hypothetical protein n=1 Tax=Thermopolyspora sp. NPDC052614 TaxID=3155682 RepID=UPI00342C2516
MRARGRPRRSTVVSVALYCAMSGLITERLTLPDAVTEPSPDETITRARRPRPAPA